MKTFNFGRYRINYCFSFYQVTKLKLAIPDKADDTHYNYDAKAIIYWIGPNKHTIDLPEHQKGKELALTPLYNKLRTGYNTKRFIEVELLN